jgi:GntR family transcriptional regulator
VTSPRQTAAATQEGTATEARLRAVWEDAAKAGSALPGEQTLAGMLGVSRPSIREALTRLEADGLIYRRHGAHTAVNAAALEISGRFDRHSDFRETLRRAGFAATQDLIRAEQVSLTQEEALRFGVDAGSPGMRVIKRWRADGIPAQVAIDLFPMPDDESLDLDESLFALVSAQRGEPVRWEVAIPAAVNATAEVAGWMEVEENSALLTLESLGVTASGARAFWAFEYFRPHLVKLGMIRSISS